MKNKIMVLSMVGGVLAGYVWAASGKAVIKGTAADSKISGDVVFMEEKDGLRIKAIFLNVSPGKHGFHIHENGSCDDMGKAAGGHFNPDGSEHGYLPKQGHQHAHAGDMGNIKISENGTGSLDVLLPGLALKEGKYAIAGRSIILHEKSDDFGQPTGNAGGRIGCGVIEEVVK